MISVYYYRFLFSMIITVKAMSKGDEGIRFRCYARLEDKEVKLEEIETSHTLGGSGKGRVQGRGKLRGCTCYSAPETSSTTHGRQRPQGYWTNSILQQMKRNFWNIAIALFRIS